MKNIKKTILLAGAAILASVSVASAQIVNAQFIGEDGGGAYGTLYAGTGAVGTGTYWNSVKIPDGALQNPSIPTPILENDGVTNSGYSISLTGVESFNWAAYGPPLGPSGNSLLDSAAVEPLDTPTFTIGGLTPGGTYNLYLFGNSGYYSQTTEFTIGLTTHDSTGNTSTGLTANSALTDAGVDYALFTGVIADGSGDITGTWTGPGVGENAPFNGLQIQAETPAVPEPSVVILLGLGFMSLLVLRRARRIS